MNTEIILFHNGDAAAIQKAAALLKSGKLVAFPTETVYGLGAFAYDAKAVERIFAVKGRPNDNPLIVHVSDLSMATSLAADWTETAQKLAKAFWPGPLSIVVKASPAIPGVVTAGLGTVAIRMPGHRAALELIAQTGPIAAPSANLSGRPSPVKAAHVYEDFHGKIPLILDGGTSDIGLESTVADARNSVPVVLRPGGVTCEMIRAVCGGCNLADGMFQPVTVQAASPGMLHTHYAPTGRATLIAPHQNMVKTMREQYDAARSQGFVPVILCSSGTAKGLDGRTNICLDDGGNMAHGLFDALRKADEMGCDRVFIEGVPIQGLGMAYMNRALRAAGFDIWEDMV